MVSFRITIIAIYLKAYVFFSYECKWSWNGTKNALNFFSPFSTMGPKMYDNLKRNYIGSIWIKTSLQIHNKRFATPGPIAHVCLFYLLRSECFLCEFLSSFRTRLDLECNFWKIVLKSCSWNKVSRMPSSITIPSLLFKTGCWSMSKSMVMPDREVSEPITLRRSSEKLENKAALATMRVRILVFSSLGCLAAAGYLKGWKKGYNLKKNISLI